MVRKRLVFRNIILSLFCILILRPICIGQTSVSKISWNDHISQSERNQIKTLNGKLINAFKVGDNQKLAALFSDSLKVVAGDMYSNLLRSLPLFLSSGSLITLDEYFSENPAIGVTDTLSKNLFGDNAYRIVYINNNQFTYVSLMVFKREENELLFTCIYGKYGDGWKLNKLEIGRYKAAGDNAVNLYKRAKREYLEGNWADAAVDMAVARDVALPAKDIFRYNKLSDMTAFGIELNDFMQSKNDLYPIAVTEIKTFPQIIGIEPVIIPDGVFTRINYLSQIKTTNIEALTIENNQLKKIIGKFFPGTDKNKKYLFLKAYNEVPNGNKATQGRGFVLTRSK